MLVLNLLIKIELILSLPLSFYLYTLFECQLSLTPFHSLRLVLNLLIKIELILSLPPSLSYLTFLIVLVYIPFKCQLSLTPYHSLRLVLNLLIKNESLSLPPSLPLSLPPFLSPFFFGPYYVFLVYIHICHTHSFIAGVS